MNCQDIKYFYNNKHHKHFYSTGDNCILSESQFEFQKEILFFDILPPVLIDDKHHVDILHTDLYNFCVSLSQFLFRRMSLYNKKLFKNTNKGEDILITEETILYNLLARKFIKHQISMYEQYGFYQKAFLEKQFNEIKREYRSLKIQPFLYEFSDEEDLFLDQKAQAHRTLQFMDKQLGFKIIPNEHEYEILHFGNIKMAIPFIAQTRLSDLDELYYVKIQPIHKQNKYDLLNYQDIKILLYFMLTEQKFNNIKYLKVLFPKQSKTQQIDLFKLKRKRGQLPRQLKAHQVNILEHLKNFEPQDFLSKLNPEMKNKQCEYCSLSPVCSHISYDTDKLVKFY